ncbi:MAG TPA: hypothetical protein VGW12_00725 [Pyrinomonadaceae bacterium]|nr:hypothetical protein [Pyrinomonadaceae bacterium]
MTYLIYFGIVVAAGYALTLASDSFAYAVSRTMEAGFDYVEYRLALRARERRSMQRDAQVSQTINASVVMPFRAADLAAANKRSTQQLDVARVAA